MDGALPEAPTSGPAHVAIIMDGNGRWARARGMPRSLGHHRGAEAVRRVVEAAPDLGVTHLTLFGFSSENWARPQEEVGELMSLLRKYLRSEIAELHANGVRLRVIGERRKLAADIVELIENAEALTADNTGLQLTIALSYGARQELAAAARRLADDVRNGLLAPEDVDEAAVASRLFTCDLPDPDLIIRSSGEKRISNFLLWQAAYAELVFVETLWPDFTREHLATAISEYRRRERRFGVFAGGR
ncbi:MAG: isoprenyl transferase [Inquilinus sp.]|nr:isoprenyl transferase [Inquilinus sp.]